MLKAENLQFLDYQNNLEEQFFKQNTFSICYRWFQIENNTLELSAKMLIGTNNWGVETKKKRIRMCSRYVRLYVEFVVHVMSSFLQE